MVSFADGTLGLVKVFPGELVMLTPDGLPAGAIKLVAGVGSGGFVTMHRALQGGGTLLLGASTMTMNPDMPIQSRSFFLGRFDRDAFELSWYSPDGAFLQSATLPAEPRQRNKLAHDRMHGILDRQARHVPGTFAAYDVIDRTGHYIQRVTVVCAGDATRDRLLISGNRAYRVAGYWDAVYRVQGSDADESPAEAAEPMSVTCYRIR